MTRRGLRPDAFPYVITEGNMLITVRRRMALTTATALAAFGLATAASAGQTAGQHAALDPALRSVHGTVSVIVQGAGEAARRAVSWMGGRVTHDLPLIDGFSAEVPAGDVGRIASVPGVRAVSLDGTMHVQAAGGSDPDSLPSVYRKVVRADDLAAAGGNGQGVTVALIDTGVTPMPDLAGRIVQVTTDPLGLTTASCVDFTASSSCDDEYGHGTFIAGLIAGNGSSSGGQYVGTAPGARILSVKIAGRDGSADVSDVLAAIQWVVSFKDSYGIKVLNLSLGTDSTQSYRVDPLNYAVERAWQSGIAVVVSAANRGPAAGTISKPADDPYVITVGATDDMGTSGLGDDTLPNFSSRGPTAADGLAKPDVVAPGAHLVSLAAPGAAITSLFPPGMPAPYRRGSGTSFATAVVSGVVADMLSLQPGLTPDRVKFELTSTAHATNASSDPMAIGSGVVDGYAALFDAPAGLADQGLTPGDGSGSIELQPRRRPRRGGRAPVGDRRPGRGHRPAQPLGPALLGGRGVDRLELVRLELVRLELVRVELVRVELVRVELVRRHRLDRLELVRVELVRVELVRLELVRRLGPVTPAAGPAVAAKQGNGEA